MEAGWGGGVEKKTDVKGGGLAVNLAVLSFPRNLDYRTVRASRAILYTRCLSSIVGCTVVQTALQYDKILACWKRVPLLLLYVKTPVP